MNKQEAIESIKKISDDLLEVKFVSLESVIDIVSQIHEPQKVVVPKHIAEWIDALGKHGLFGLNYDSVDQSVWDWVNENYDCNVKKLHSAYLYGYEVEKEQLYTVEIPNPNNRFGVVFLIKEKGKVCIGTGTFFDNVPDDKWKKDPNTHLTESEIKEDFEWAWKWAVPVEVVEK
ncbi:TPA: DUF1642 domain-containing protein [Streptococcus suis]